MHGSCIHPGPHSIATTPYAAIISNRLNHPGQTLVKEDDASNGYAGLDLYFLEEDGSRFKATLLFEPYFLLVCRVGALCACLADLAHLPGSS
jgi:hypothetical protein